MPKKAPYNSPKGKDPAPLVMDFITDIDADIASLGEKGSEPLIDEDQLLKTESKDDKKETADLVSRGDPKAPLVTVDKTGVARNKKGQFVEGSVNPATPAKKIKLAQMKKIIESKTGKDCERILQKLSEIAMYDPDMPMMDKDPKTGEWVSKKRRFHFYNATTQMQAITLLLAYVYGRPTESKEVDKQVDVRIDKRVADITQLINANKERLKVVK